MKNNNSTFIVLGGIFILSVFSFIVAKNILPDSDNNQYYARPNENMTAKIVRTGAVSMPKASAAFV